MPLLAHLVFVGLMAYRRSGKVENMLWGFLHDAHEVVTADVPRPFKCDCMRFEQQAIDERLLAAYFGDYYAAPIDYDLIKQCDTDALHIEAVMLGLPGFTEVELKYAQDYCGEKHIHDDIADKELFQRIFGSPFCNDTIQGEDSHGVRRFACCLTLAEKGQYTNMTSVVRGWGLLD